jgi:hypothetical protein
MIATILNLLGFIIGILIFAGALILPAVASSSSLLI